MNTTPDSVQPDPRDITPDGFRMRAEEDDVEGHKAMPTADAEPAAEGFRALADGDDDAEGHVYKP